MAGGVANAKEYHLVFSSGNFYCFFSPWIPSYWIILMLSQIRRKLRSELVRLWSSSGSHCSTAAVQGFLLFTVYRVTFLWKKVKEAQLMSTMRRWKLFIFSKHWTPPLGLVDWLDQSETGPQHQLCNAKTCSECLKAKKFAEPLFQKKKNAEKVRKSGRHF